jgi:hypothetical protein
MKRKLFPVLALLLLAAFVLYAHSSLRLSGPGDKAVQLALVFPAVLLFALSGLAPFKPVISFYGSLSTGAFLTAILVPVFIFMIWMAVVPLEGIPKGGDEAAYLFQSRIFAAGSLTAPAPPVHSPRDLFPFRHFIYRGGDWYVMYTPLHGVLMAPFTAAGLSWLLGPLESVISLLGAFLLMRRLAGENTARTGAAVMAMSPFFLFMGSSHMAHNSNLMFVTWALYYLVRGLQNEDRACQAASGLLLGLALNTKPYPIAPWAITITLVLVAKMGRGAIPVLLRIAAGALLPLALFLLSNHRFSGNPFSPAYNLARGGELMGFGENKAWFPEYGDHAHTPARGLLNLLKQAGTGSTILLGWPFLSFLPALAVILDGNAFRRARPLILSILMIAPFMFVHYAAAIDYGPRHYYTALPSFALLSAAGIGVLVRKWGAQAETAVSGLFLVSTMLIYIPDGVRVRSGPWQTIDSVPIRLAEEMVEAPAVVFMEASEHGYPNIMSGILATDPFLKGDIVFCAHQSTLEDREHIQGLFHGRNAYLFYEEDGEFFMEPWSEDLSDRLSPERDLRPHWVPENLPEAGF